MEAITRTSAMVLCVALLTACGSGPGEGGTSNGTGTGAGSSRTSVAPPAEGSVSAPGATGQTGALTAEELARLERIVSGAEDAAAQVEREAGTDTGTGTRR